MFAVQLESRVVLADEEYRQHSEHRGAESEPPEELLHGHAQVAVTRPVQTTADQWDAAHEEEEERRHHVRQLYADRVRYALVYGEDELTRELVAYAQCCLRDREANQQPDEDKDVH